MRILVGIYVAVLLVACGSTGPVPSPHLSNGFENELHQFLAAWLTDPRTGSAKKWVGGGFRLIGATAPMLRNSAGQLDDWGILSRLPWSCGNIEEACVSIDSCLRPMRSQEHSRPFELDRLAVDSNVVRAQPALEPWEGMSLLEVDFILSQCGVGVSLLFQWSPDGLVLVAALVAAS